MCTVSFCIQAANVSDHFLQFCKWLSTLLYFPLAVLKGACADPHLKSIPRESGMKCSYISKGVAVTTLLRTLFAGALWRRGKLSSLLCSRRILLPIWWLNSVVDMTASLSVIFPVSKDGQCPECGLVYHYTDLPPPNEMLRQAHL